MSAIRAVLTIPETWWWISYRKEGPEVRQGQGWAALEGGHLRVILGMALQNDCGGPWHSGGLGGLEVCMCACPPFSGCFSGLPEEIIYKQATDR